MELVKRLARGDKTAIARAITIVENNEKDAVQIMKGVYPLAGKAHVIGITGPSGVGKSCLLDGLIGTYRKMCKKVGVIAVDPTSPFTGGAILGDRIRMQKHSLDEGVYIRSMGSRGSLGGLSHATKASIDILSAAGMDIILVETVGIGQVEVDIVRYADTIVIVLVPELGDGIQALKAGLLEIGDIFVVNKADHRDADKTVLTIRESLTLTDGKGWTPPVLKTIATTGKGMHELVAEIKNHWAYIDSSGARKGKHRDEVESEIIEKLENEFAEYLQREIASKSSFRELVQATASRHGDPRSAAEELFKEIMHK